MTIEQNTTSPTLATTGLSRGLVYNAFGSHITALQMLSHLKWGSASFRALAEILCASDGKASITAQYEQWLVDARPRIVDDLQPIHVRSTPLVLVDKQIHRGYWSVHVASVADYDTMLSTVQLINNEISARVAQILAMRMKNPNAAQADPFVVGVTTEEAVQSDLKNNRGDYSPLSITATLVPAVNSGDSPTAIYDLITIDDVEEAPNPKKTLIMQLTYLAVTEWLADQNKSVHAKSTN